MNYLDKYDKVVSVRCCNLTPAQKLRTGFRTMGDVKRAVALIHNPLNYKAFGKSAIQRSISDDIENILMATATPSGIRAVKLDRGDDQVVRPQAEDNFGDDFSDAGSYLSYDSPPLSAVAEEEIIGQNIQQQVALFERGIIDQRELQDNIRQLRGAIREVAEVAVEPDEEGNLIPVAEREEIVGREQAYSTAVPAPEPPEMGRLQRQPSLPEEESPQPQYIRPRLRRIGGETVQTEMGRDVNRGSGTGQVNPEAPSYSAGGYERGESREAGRNPPPEHRSRP